MRRAKFVAPVVLLVAAFVVIADKTEATAKNRLLLRNAVITAINTETKTITATKDETVYTIDASQAKLHRRYGARCDIYEFMTGDYISVLGKIEGTNITARKIKDNSIQRWKGSFIGTITAVDSSTHLDNRERSYQQFEIQSRYRGSQTVRVYDTTQIKYKGESKTFSDLSVGQKVVTKGTWNNTHSIVYDTRWVKIHKLTE